MDLNAAAWRKSSYSGNNGGDCVEVAAVRGQTAPGSICVIRDSKDPDSQVLAFDAKQWQQFTARVKAGTPGPA